MKTFSAAVFVCWGLAVTASAEAQVEVGAVMRNMPELAASERVQLLRALDPEHGQRVSLLVRTPLGSARAKGMVSVGRNLFALDAKLEELPALAAQHPDWQFQWSAPRRLLLDQADVWTRASAFRSATELTGKGVVVGIVDTGVDLRHRDLRAGDGSTRVRWLIDFSRSGAGKHPELETRFGCLPTEPSCAILDDADINALIKGESSADTPTDPIGHGTHVASLAVGNGLASGVPRYVGVAPEANLIIARVTRAGGATIQDSDILKAVSFVFEQAEALGMPAVVNLSLGGDFGAHDGTSELETGLAEFVGPSFPGRSIVVAAGNSAGLYFSDGTGYPQPLGVHTEVHVPRESPATVPILAPQTEPGRTSGTIYVWISSRAGDKLSVGLNYNREEWVQPVPPGKSGAFNHGDLKATVYNGAGSLNSPVAIGSYGAVVVLTGSWPSQDVFSLLFDGYGSAELWLQSEGALSPEFSLGALFPKAEKQGTITIPASHPNLIAVGASVNRTAWTDFAGGFVEQPEHGSFDNVPLDSIAYFSSAGPNALGILKPDIVAPGVNVVGAMSALADPRSRPGGVFASLGRCGDATQQCFVVDETHAVTSGTSMAAPIVAGAVALLFARDPTLTQDQVRALLQAGARKLQGSATDEQQVGVGALDLEGALSAAIAEDSPIDRVPSANSWLSLGASFMHPDPEWPLFGYLELRDEQSQIADGFDPARLRLAVSGADVREALTRVAPGLWRFAVAAARDSGGTTVTLSANFDGRTLVSRDVLVGVDRWVAEEGASARGGCSVAAPHSRGGLSALTALFAIGFVRRARRRGGKPSQRLTR